MCLRSRDAPYRKESFGRFWMGTKICRHFTQGQSTCVAHFTLCPLFWRQCRAKIFIKKKPLCAKMVLFLSLFQHNYYGGRQELLHHGNSLVPLRLPGLQFLFSLSCIHTLVILAVCSAKKNNPKTPKNLRNCNNAISFTNALLCICLHHMEHLEAEG